jgi:hypothetical protein
MSMRADLDDVRRSGERLGLLVAPFAEAIRVNNWS